MKSPTIPEVEPQFEKEIEIDAVEVADISQIDLFQLLFQHSFQQPVIRCETPTLSAKRRSQIFEETLPPVPSLCPNTKSEDDALLLLNADKTELIEAYNKIEVDALLDDKLNITNQIDANTKQKDDVLLLLKADKTLLAGYVDLTSTQTIKGHSITISISRAKIIYFYIAKLNDRLAAVFDESF
ncbi:MAG: hypothetical protein EZS28_022414 [Streblomastix strix]|uniref:Uncharacterized protein n=1 Tax=Streblomastix strix TaxID=222440 RepID=A0A5J4VHT2_9EUKA|nr:MAG: hypothetical protein EZS28_022414 [Streblomastix strix]